MFDVSITVIPCNERRNGYFQIKEGMISRLQCRSKLFSDIGKLKANATILYVKMSQRKLRVKISTALYIDGFIDLTYEDLDYFNKIVVVESCGTRQQTKSTSFKKIT